METNDRLTKKEIFEQIKLLQKEMTSNNANSLYRLSDTVNELRDEEGNVYGESISDLCAVFSQREENLTKLLNFYIRLYDEADIGE